MVMVSYVLLDGVNDSDECACQLRDLVKGRPVIVNLISYNPFDGNVHDYKCPSAERVDAFLHILESADIRVFERRHHGRDIAAACGQLAKISAEQQTGIDIESCSGKLAKERIRQNWTKSTSVMTSIAEGMIAASCTSSKSEQGISRVFRLNWYTSSGILALGV